MEQTGLMDELLDTLYGEKFSTDQEAASPLRTETNIYRADLLRLTKEAGKTGDIDLILEVEQAFLINDLKLYGNSPEMRGSLNTAIAGVKQAEQMLELVRNPEQYEVVNRSHALPKSRKGSLPYDEARKFFPSQRTRLKNMDKSRLSAEEKKIITARQDNLRVAEKIYIRYQHKALGVEATAKSRVSRDHGLEME